MADEATPDQVEAPEADAVEDNTNPDPDAQILADARDPDAVKNALKREREAAKEAARERDEYKALVAEFQDRDKSEHQKAVERAAQFEQELQLERQDKLRLAVANEKGLVGDRSEIAELLKGTTREEIAAHADRLLALFPAQQETSFDGGARGTPPTQGGMDGMIRRAVGR